MKVLRMLLIFSVVGLAFLATGCVHEDEASTGSTLPWSRPATWEDQQLGVPF